MNIAFLTVEYITEDSFSGGLANYLYRTAKALVKSGNHVEVFTLSDRDGLFEHEGIVVHQIKQYPILLKIIWIIFLRQCTYAIKVLYNSYVMNHRLLKRHREVNFDIVQSTGSRAIGFFTARQKIIPVITRMSIYREAWDEYEYKKITKDLHLIHLLEKRQRHYSRAVYAPSRLLAGIIGSREPGIRVDVIRPPFAIEVESMDESVYHEQLENFKYFLFFGSLCRTKGVEVLAYSIQRLFNLGEKMFFVFAGRTFNIDGLNAMDYINQTVGEGTSRIKYLGALRHRQLYPVISHAHAIILPSLIENFPNACLESIALGKVVIGTRGVSFDEIIEDGISGFLVDRNNPEQLAEILKTVWNMSQDELVRMGDEAKKKIEELNPQQKVAELVKYFMQNL